MIARFTIPGSPVPKARPRFDRRTGRTYTPTKSRHYEKLVAAESYAASRWVRLQQPGQRTLERRSPPWPTETMCAKAGPRRSKRAPSCDCPWCSSAIEIDLRIHLPDKRTRDIDNIEKSLLDGMNGVLFRDDRQVRAVSKRATLDRKNPRVEVVVRLFEPAQERLGIPNPEIDDACPECEGVGSFHVDLPSGIRREVICGPCMGLGRVIT